MTGGLKWGVIGAGGIARKRFIPALQGSSVCGVTGICDVDSNVVRDIKNEFGIPYGTTDVDELLQNEEIQAVYIASPLFMHMDHCLKAAAAKKHILCEKPIALDLQQAERIRECCRKNNVFFMNAYMMRFHPAHQKIKEMIGAGQIGNIVMARAQLSHYKVEYGPAGEPTWRHQKKLSAGGSLMDMGIHCVDLLRWWIGEVTRVTGSVDTLENDYDVEDTGIGILKFENRAIGIVDSTFAAKGARHRVEIYGTEGSIFAENTISQLSEGEVYLNNDNGYQKIDFKPQNMYYAEACHLTRCIQNKTEPSVSFLDAMKNLEIILSIYRSSEEEITVPIK